MQPSMREVGRYYCRVVQRGLRDSRSAISKNGLTAGLGVALATAIALAVLEDEFNLLNAAIAACAGFAATVLVVIAWHVFRAPVLIAAEDAIDAQARLQAEHAGWKANHDEIAAALAASEAERARLEGIADQQAPKRALIEQLRKAETLGPHILAALGLSREESEQRRREDAKVIRSWEFGTRELIKELVPQYLDQFRTNARLPYDLPLPRKGPPPPPPTIRELMRYRNEAVASLRLIIRQL